MELKGYGYEGNVQPVEAAVVRAHEERIFYDRGNITEWYVNGVLGLEQGFTIDAEPGREDSPNSKTLAIELEVQGDLRPVWDEEGRTVDFIDSRGLAVLHYGKLRVFDATGAELPAFLALSGAKLRIRVEDTDAVYPITVDPLIFSQTKILPSDGAAEHWFGYSLSIDGDTAVVGQPGNTIPGEDIDEPGAAYVFVSSGGTWIEQAKLEPADGQVTDEFGIDVAISGDTVVVGSWRNDGVASNSGAAYVFTRSGTTWTEEEKLLPSGLAEGDWMGEAVAIDGDTIVLGTRRDSDAGTESGSAYVFARSGGSWSEQAKLTASDAAAQDRFGTSVSVSGDTVIVGAPGQEDDARTDAGAAYVFVRSGLSWSQQAKLKASDGELGDVFGQSVSVDGDTAVIGAFRHGGTGAPGGSTDPGAAYVFVRSGTTWIEQTKLDPPPGAGAWFGRFVSIDGDVAVIAATMASVATVFVRTGDIWSPQAQLRPTDLTSGNRFSRSVSVSGVTLIGGAHQDDTNGTDAGAAYIFEFQLAGLDSPGGTVCGPAGSGACFGVGSGILTGPTDILFSVIASPGLPPPPGFASFGTSFVDITLVPNPGPLISPGATITLPMVLPIAEGTLLPLFKFDMVSGTYADTGIVGVVDPGGLTATFDGVTEFSVFVGVASTLCNPTPEPEANCHTAVAAAKSLLVLKDDSPDRKDQVRWKWAKGQATTTDQFSDPVTNLPSIHFCLYDGSATSQPLLDSSVPASGICDGKPCWRATGERGFKYKDRVATADGVLAVRLKNGIDGKARITLKSKGDQIGEPTMPSLPLTTDVTAQLLIYDSENVGCWQTTFSTTVKNEPGRFKAKGP